MPKAVEAYHEILTADPTHAETLAALERLFIGRHAAARDRRRPRAAVPRRAGVGEAAPDLRGPARAARPTRPSARRCCTASPRSPSRSSSIRSRPSAGGRQAVKEDPRRSRRSTSSCAWRARPTSGTPTSPRCPRRAAPERPDAVRRDVLLRLAASFENELGDLERAEEALHAGAGRARSRIPRPSPPWTASTRAQGMYENLAEILRQRIAITDDTDELVELNLRLGRVYAEALDEIDPAIASYQAVLEHESRSPEALEALERLYFRSEHWEELYGVYEKLVDIAGDERAWPTATRGWPSWPPTRSTIATRAVELWGRVVDIRGEDAIALAGLGRPPRAGRGVAGADRGPREAGRGHARPGREDPDLQAPRPHLGREAVARAQLARELAEGPGAGSRRTSTPCARSRPTTGARAPGRSCRSRCAA